MRTRRLGGVAAVAMLFLGAACGSDDDSESAATTAAPAATTAASATTAPSGTTASTAAKPADDAAWKAIVDAANKEGQVTVYALSTPPFVEAINAAWAKEYPNIKLNYINLNPVDVTAKIEAELKSGLVADLVETGNHGYIQGLSKDGHLTEPVGPAFKDPAYPWATTKINEGYAYRQSTYAWAWRTDRLPKGITSWNDFLTLKPGTLGVTDPSIAAILVDQYKNIEKGAGAGFFDKLAAAKIDPQVYPGAAPTASALAAGEIDAVLDISVNNIAPLKAKGVPVDFKVYDGAWGPTLWGMVLKKAPHPNAAQVFANWHVSKTHQQIAADQFSKPMLSTVRFDAVAPGTKINASQPVTADEVKAFMERWNKLFG